MFLPIILLGRFGWAGFWAFAIPNLIGCVGFGYLFTAEQSRRFATVHIGPIRWFSLATIAFQIFFVGWSTGSFVLAAPHSDRRSNRLARVRHPTSWPGPSSARFSLGRRALPLFRRVGDLFWRWLATIIAATSGDAVRDHLQPGRWLSGCRGTDRCRPRGGNRALDGHGIPGLSDPRRDLPSSPPAVPQPTFIPRSSASSSP